MIYFKPQLASFNYKSPRKMVNSRVYFKTVFDFHASNKFLS